MIIVNIISSSDISSINTTSKGNSVSYSAMDSLTDHIMNFRTTESPELIALIAKEIC